MQDGARLKFSFRHLVSLFRFALLLAVCGTGAAAELRGHVSSREEGAMEGVLVSARRAGSPITVTVASDAKGGFRFPEGSLPPGYPAGHGASRGRGADRFRSPDTDPGGGPEGR